MPRGVAVVPEFEEKAPLAGRRRECDQGGMFIRRQRGPHGRMQIVGQARGVINYEQAAIGKAANRLAFALAPGQRENSRTIPQFKLRHRFACEGGGIFEPPMHQANRPQHLGALPVCRRQTNDQTFGLVHRRIERQ